MIIDDATFLDGVAVVFFFGVWIVYNLLYDGPLLRKNSINAQMIEVRVVWMRRLLVRDNRIVDSTLVGHSIQSATFFASTTIILAAGLVGVLGSAEQAHSAFASISVLLTRSQALFEVKVMLLIAMYVYAFFKFTWSIRQFNYFSAVLGSAPVAGEPAAADPELPRRMAKVLTQAAWQLNAGVRAHYFAIAGLGWFVHPAALMAGAAIMCAVLVRRQSASTISTMLAELLAAYGDETPGDGGA